jgi:hypothetical protein
MHRIMGINEEKRLSKEEATDQHMLLYYLSLSNKIGGNIFIFRKKNKGVFLKYEFETK